jgi:hypothetical protein
LGIVFLIVGVKITMFHIKTERIKALLDEAERELHYGVTLRGLEARQILALALLGLESFEGIEEAMTDIKRKRDELAAGIFK